LSNGISEPSAIIGDNVSVVNVASVAKLSLFRYPGGKTWLVPTVRRWLQSFARRPKLFVEPFAGGGIIGLTIAFEKLAERVILAELDAGVAAVWKTVLGDDCTWLIDQVLNFNMTRRNVLRALGAEAGNSRELAFQTILRNRVQRGGILAPGASLVRGGENGKGIRSRWYPVTLAKRMREIREHRDQISFIEGNGFTVIRKHLRSRYATFFIDPPYTAGGKLAGNRLYTHTNIDHEDLFRTMAKAQGPVMLTYDDCEEVRSLAIRQGFQFARVPMKNTHHSVMHELLITNGAASSEQAARRLLAEQIRLKGIALVAG
jgi:DNA adenine methylase